MDIKGCDREKNVILGKKSNRMRFFTLAFWDLIFCKVAEILISVKLWILMATFYFCYFGMTNDYMTGTNVATILCATIAPVVIMREGFKIAKIKDISKIVVENTKLNDDVKYAIEKLSDISS